MRKALLIVAMLLLVTPVMAATTITAVKEGAVFTAADGNKVQTVRIDYSGDVNVRAFALDINVAPGPVFRGVRGFKTGESNAVSKGYGIFPGRFRDYIVVTGPNWADTNYNPVAPSGDPGASGTGLDTNHIVVEMGTLYAGDANRPVLSGTLFRIDVNNRGLLGTFNLAIAANALRGGVVGNDGNTVPGLSFVGTPIIFAGDVLPTPAQIIYPNYDPDCNIPIYWSPVAGATGYDLDRSANGGGAWTTIVSNLNVTFKQDTVPVLPTYRYRVRAKNAVSDSDYRTGTFDCNAILSTCYRDGLTTDPNWAQWRNLGRPDCWCKFKGAGQGPRGTGYQCDGDANSDTESDGVNTFRVYNNDLALISSNWKKTTLQLTADPNFINVANHVNGLCADVDHKSESDGVTTFRVYNKDIAIVTGNWKKRNSSSLVDPLPGNCPR